MANHRKWLKTTPALPVPRLSVGEREKVLEHRRSVGARRLAALRDAEAHRAAEEAETRRLMLNWAQWREGVSISVAVSSAWSLEAKGTRAASSVPLLNGEASDVDAAVDALPPDLHEVVIEYWTKKGDADKHARVCRCSVRTFWRRLDHAHERVRALLRAKRDQAERARLNYQRLRSCAVVK